MGFKLKYISSDKRYTWMKKNYDLKNFHILTEIGMIFNSYGKDGGLFIFIGVKN